MASLFVLLISALSIFSVSADDAVNIDCGTSGTYVTENFVVWTGDDIYIVNGESHTVQNTNLVLPEINTLRAFTTRKKNCYTIPVGKGERVLVRATFFYGNYDKQSSPPTFDLHFDGNYWATVETSSTDYVYYETTYVVKGDYVSVCVALTRPGQFPFISALELHSLPPPMYDYDNVHQNYPLHLMARNAFGSTTRYVDYTYNRIWTPVAGGGGGITAVTGDAYIVDTTTVKDAPPPAVLQNAVTASSPTAGITLLNGVFPSHPISICLNMYFSEVMQLDETQNRSFQIVMNNDPLLETPFAPSYANTTEFSFENVTVFENTTFSLLPTAGSTEPPLINAMELFQIGDALTDGTDSRDVDGLDSLRNAFAELQDWGGDPCLPAPYSWDWIECSNDSTPRVTALHLSSVGLTGNLPDFSSMDALETIDFHNNSLDGSIPDFLSTLPNLKQLNLAKNQFSGPIPDSLTKKKGLNLVVTENPDLCTSGKECKTSSSSPSDDPGFSRSNPRSSRGGGAKKKKSKLPVILGTTLPISIIVWAAIGVKVVLRHRRKAGAVAASSSGGNGPQSSPLNPQMMKKMGETIMNEMKINMDQDQDQDQQSNVVEPPAEDQTYQQQDGTTAH